MSCKKAQGFLAENDVRVREQIDARKIRLGERDAIALTERADRILVARGRKVLTFERKGGGFDERELLGAIIGPSGNLRAPAILRGKTLYVGFSEEAYEQGLA